MAVRVYELEKGIIGGNYCRYDEESANYQSPPDTGVGMIQVTIASFLNEIWIRSRVWQNESRFYP
jgi:hypothetical protein